ncbi:extensin [Paracoccus sp. S-4012]|uniref:extensin-like domain-containing protein n=1 Tax=Paracoccus sp. S-4012 TaxID=2665648 RepID=UPI0012B097B6|nr:extensin family protein [Paracoccus sp. S-4012]MRX49254.1 extensin [Paracoccus sp. S-4012]
MAEARHRRCGAALAAAVALLPLIAPAQPAAEPARPPTRPEAEAAAGAVTQPATQGALIPPKEMARRRAATTPPGPPAHSLLRESDFAFAACRLSLTLMGTDYATAPPVSDAADRDCGIDRPLRIGAILPGVTLPGAPLMRCATAQRLAMWMRDFVQPAASRLPGAPRVAGLEPGSTYDCRPRIGGESEQLSEHALGNAFDIMAFVMEDGRRIMVEPEPADSADAAFLTAVRGAACMDFATVLGPGSDAAHDDHLHLDIRRRESGHRLCQ